MEFLINDPKIIRYPPAEVRLLDLRADPNPEKKRLRITLELTPFQQKPNIELAVTDSSGNEVTSASIIETDSCKLELNLHMKRTEATDGKFTLMASLLYPELGEIDRHILIIEAYPPVK
jgi:hypothetical protein